MKERLMPLTTLPFIIFLMLLLFNDFYLKAVYHNTITGKLSDVGGLFIFPIFWSVVLPKYKKIVFITTGLFFIYWKSIYSQDFIDFFSAYFFRIDRTVDLTDLLALPILGLAWLTLQSGLRSIYSLYWLQRYIPYLIAGVALFSFVATSQPKYMYSFDQPQYILLKSDTVPEANYYNEDFICYKIDSLLVVKINQLYTSQRAIKNDDHEKNLMVRNLDKNIINLLQGNALPELINPEKITSIGLQTKEGEDLLRFKGGRLDGLFIRKNQGKKIIEGFYKNGIEDSVWIFRDQKGHIIKKLTFVDGERTLVQYFENNHFSHSENRNTRADTVRNKGIMIAFLILSFFTVLLLIIKNYRNSPDKLQLKPILKWMLCMVLPIAVWALQLCLVLIIGDYNVDIFNILGMALLIYLITCPLFFLVIFWIKITRPADVLWYCFLFAVAFCILIEYNIFVSLS